MNTTRDDAYQWRWEIGVIVTGFDVSISQYVCEAEVLNFNDIRGPENHIVPHLKHIWQ